LNPADWSGPVVGFYWTPRGKKIGLGNKSGDNIQVYVNDLKTGKKLHLYDGWNIWYDVVSSRFYYHTIAPPNEVDISTLVIVYK
jgi:hypothetical protein